MSSPEDAGTQALRSVSMRVDYDAICRYGELTCDPNPIHTDRAFAAGTEMKGIIAQGTLSLGVLWQSLADTFGPERLHDVVLDVRFVRPVRENDLITASGNALDAKAGRFRVQVSNDRGEVVVEGTAELPGAG